MPKGISESYAYFCYSSLFLWSHLVKGNFSYDYTEIILYVIWNHIVKYSYCRNYVKCKKVQKGSEIAYKPPR